MATINAPGQILRQFYIGGDLYRSRDDEDYYLIFACDGSMYVQVFTHRTSNMGVRGRASVSCLPTSQITRSKASASIRRL